MSTAKDRVKFELLDLKEKNTKLGNLLGKIKSEDWTTHKQLLSSFTNEQKNLLKKQYSLQKKYNNLLKKQYSLQKQYIRVLEKRLKLWTEE